LAAGVDQLDGKEEQEGEVEADPVGDGRVGHELMLSQQAHTSYETRAR
jgi:hypothetical protein